MKRTAIILMVATIVTKIFGFAKTMILSYLYGASNISDAYIISLTIPTVVFGVIGVAIFTGYIPMYSKIDKEYGEEEANKFTNNLLNILIIISTIIITFGLLFTEVLVKLFASGFEGETLILAIQFTKISLLGIYFIGAIYIFTGFLQLKGNYFVPALVGLPLNLFLILSISLSSKTNVLVLAIGIVIAVASQLFLLIPFIYKEGYRYEFILSIKDEHIKAMGYIALPIIIGVSVDQLNILVDKTIASTITSGSISALNYANSLNGFIQGLFIAPITTIMYPVISKMAADNNIDGLKKSISEAINSISFLVLPATIGAMIFAKPVVTLLFGRGEFDSHAISITSTSLLFYSIGMIGVGFREVLSRGFYSLQDIKTVTINGVVATSMNIILNIILSKYMGIGGLALSTSISSIFCTVLLFISFRKRIGSFGMRRIIISFLKILFGSLVMGVLSKFSFNYLTSSLSQNLSLLIAIGIGASSYFVIMYFMKIEEMNTIINVLREKIIK